VAICQVDAARCIASTQDRSLVPTLTRALAEQRDEYDTGDGMIYVRASIAEALGVLGDERAIQPLTRAFGESGVEARTAISYALAVFGEKARAAGSKLAEAFDTPNLEAAPAIERLRAAAARSLCRVAPNVARATFAPVLREPFGDLRATRTALDAMRQSDVLPGLDDTLRVLADSFASRLSDAARSRSESCLLWWVCEGARNETERRGGAFSGPDCSRIDPECSLARLTSRSHR
jgi:HEAT repeat protein